MLFIYHKPDCIYFRAIDVLNVEMFTMTVQFVDFVAESPDNTFCNTHQYHMLPTMLFGY